MTLYHIDYMYFGHLKLSWQSSYSLKTGPYVTNRTQNPNYAHIAASYNTEALSLNSMNGFQIAYKELRTRGSGIPYFFLLSSQSKEKVLLLESRFCVYWMCRIEYESHRSRRKRDVYGRYLYGYSPRCILSLFGFFVEIICGFGGVMK